MWSVPAAAKYPERPIRIISITGAGTGADEYSRLMAKYMTEKLGQPVIIENRPGGNTIVGTSAVKSAPADGYTFLYTAASTFGANPYLYSNLPYTDADFVPVARLHGLPLVIVTAGNSKYHTLADLQAAAKANPGKLNYGTSTAGYRVIMAAFNDAAGIKATEVPYKSTSGMIIDLQAGQIDYTVIEIASVTPQVRAGKLIAIGAVGTQRASTLPEVPTLTEQGLDFAIYSWMSLFAAKGTPQEAIDAVSKAALEFVNSPEAAEHHKQRGTYALPGTPAELGKQVLEDQKAWKAAIDKSGIKVE